MALLEEMERDEGEGVRGRGRGRGRPSRHARHPLTRDEVERRALRVRGGAPARLAHIVVLTWPWDARVECLECQAYCQACARCMMVFCLTCKTRPDDPLYLRSTVVTSEFCPPSSRDGSPHGSPVP